jgi:hypothetical protein
MTVGNTTIFMDKEGQWQVSSPPSTHSPISTDDFVRTLILLEQPLKEVEAMLGPDFPYMQCIMAGLRRESDYWTGLALGWVADSPSDVYGQVRDHLHKVAISRRLSQKNRHSAFRLIRQRAGLRANPEDAP